MNPGVHISVICSTTNEVSCGSLYGEHHRTGIRSRGSDKERAATAYPFCKFPISHCLLILRRNRSKRDRLSVPRLLLSQEMQ